MFYSPTDGSETETGSGYWIGLAEDQPITVFTDPPGPTFGGAPPREVAMRHHHVGAVQKILARELAPTGSNASRTDPEDVADALLLAPFEPASLIVDDRELPAESVVYKDLEFVFVQDIYATPVIVARPATFVGAVWPAVVSSVGG